MDTSQSAFQQNQLVNKTQNTQQGSSKQIISQQWYIENLLQDQDKKGADYQRGQSNNIRNDTHTNRSKYQGNYNSLGRNDIKIRKINQIQNSSSFLTQNSQDLKASQKFGFIKAETIYGSGQQEGVLNCEAQIQDLQKYVRGKSDKNRFSGQQNENIIKLMQQYIKDTNENQKEFIEYNMNSVDAAAHQRYLKYENNEQSILNKLHEHIHYVKERDHINQLMKEELMKNSFIPCKIDDETDISIHTKINVKSSQDNHTSSNQHKKSPQKDQKSPMSELNMREDHPTKLIVLQKDANNFEHQAIDKSIIKLQINPPSQKNSSQNSPRFPPSHKNSQQTSPRFPPSKLQTLKLQPSKESQSPTRTALKKLEATPEPEILLDNIRSYRAPSVEENKSVPFLKQPTLKDTQQHEDIDEKKSILKNKRALKNKIEKIISKHKQVIKDIDYAYQEVTEHLKRRELFQRMRSISDANSPNQFSFTGNTTTQGFQIKEQNGIGGGKQNLQRIGKKIMDSLKNNGPIQNSSQTFQFNQQKQINSSNINPLNQINIPVSQSGNVSSALQSLEFQKKQLIENIQNTQNENKIYFQAKYKLREKNLNFDLSNTNNKEQVLDRVLMNYFHQQDLLNEQENLLKKAYREKKSSRSVGRAKPYKTKELGSVLSKFDPKHMRLQMKDLTKGGNGGFSSNMQIPQGKQRSLTANPGSRKAVLADKKESSGQDQQDYFELENVDFEIYKEDNQWKKRQYKIINSAKICSPAEMVLQFMKQDPRYKKQQNIEAIDFLVQYDPLKAKEEEDMEGKEQDSPDNQEKYKKRFDDSIMRRCFFFYSNKNDANTSDRFQEVTLQKFLALFYNLGGQQYDETAEQESAMIFNQSFSNAQEPVTNQIQFFSHIKKQNVMLNLKGDQTNKNKQNNAVKIITLGDNFIEIQTLKTIFEKITSKKEKHVLNYYEFLEAIRKTSIQYYLKKISQDQIPQPQELFETFFKEFIRPMHMSFRDPEEQELLNMRSHKQIDSLLKLFEDNLKDLFVFAGSMRSQTTYDFSQIYLGFHEMYEILQKLDFFPNKISKTTIRYLYYYTLSLDQGLDFQDFCQCLHLIGLRIIRFPLKNVPITQTPQDLYNLKRKCREIQYTTFKLKQEGVLNQNMQKFIQDISLFYVHKDYLDYQKIQQKIISIKEQNQKQMQMM
ncbi:hypothetical protein ABPG73_016149 [Tetrahymena malaccensis]